MFWAAARFAVITLFLVPGIMQSGDILQHFVRWTFPLSGRGRSIGGWPLQPNVSLPFCGRFSRTFNGDRI